ncbi:MAG: transcriptional repressor [Oscillospiraceae bacterium]|jgi:Fur family ferric uptake transcriptional regulator|nr:transcriptional repressor [Oscillospiraceae bacterium]
MRRAATYSTKQGEAVLRFLASQKDTFFTASQITERLRGAGVAISRPTVYRRLEGLVAQGKARKYLFHGSDALCFQYADPAERHKGHYRMECYSCHGVFSLKCDELNLMSRHILESHAFLVDGGNTVFHGKCALCLRQ